jgi:nucleolin
MSRLFIGNLPHASSEADLQQWVESNGFAVESVEIIHDRLTGMSRGFAFVTIREESGQTAINSMNGKRMNGRVLTVSQAFPLSAAVHGSSPPRRNSA